MTSPKTHPGNFFEDFRLGQEIVHATPRTVTEGDVAAYLALFGARFAYTSSSPFAQAIGFARAPVDPLLAFHLVFGKSVPDISLNAIANLGYADGRFGAAVYPGDTLRTRSVVLGLKPNTDGRTGVVYVRSTGENQGGAMVVEYTRWVMVRRRDAASTPPDATFVPQLPAVVPAASIVPPVVGVPASWDPLDSGSAFSWEDYAPGERIDHADGLTIEESDHMSAARLFQNTAKVHFNLHAERDGRFGRRIVYGGHIVSMARALSFNGLANSIGPVALHGGRHANPSFAGDTIYAWSEIIDRAPLPDRDDFGTLRVRTVATKDRPCADFPLHDASGKYDPAVVLDIDYSVLVPRRATMRPTRR
jgi:2-methylfumaryl-CoA hydratase